MLLDDFGVGVSLFGLLYACRFMRPELALELRAGGRLIDFGAVFRTGEAPTPVTSSKVTRFSSCGRLILLSRAEKTADELHWSKITMRIATTHAI